MSSCEHSQEDESSSMSVGSRGLAPLPNSDHYNLIRQRLERYRRGSEGNFRTPTEIILRIPPRLPGNATATAHRMERGTSSHYRPRRGLRPEQCVDAGNRSISPNEGGVGMIGRPRSQSLDVEDVPHNVSQMDEIDSGSSTPTSSVSRRSSVSSTSELILALESVMADLKASQADMEEGDKWMNAESAVATETEQAFTETSDKEGVRNKVSTCKRDASLEKATSLDLGKGWKTDLAEKEKLLKECKNQIRTLSSNKQQLERTCEEQREQLEYSMSFKIPSRIPLKRWPTICKGNVYDVLHPLNLDDVYSEPREIINAFLESERRYISGLSLLHTQFEEPLNMLALYKPDVLALHQLKSIFLNCSQLLLLHRSFYEDLCLIPCMSSQTAQVDRLLEICEKVFPSFSAYSPFMDTSRRQSVQKELRQLGQKPQFTEVLVHCQNSCKDTKFMDLLMMPTERLNKYSDLLTYFLDPRVRALPEDGTKRAEAIIRFLRNLRYEMLDEKSDLDHTLEKVKLLQKLAPDGPTPLEIFDSDVHLVKQGSLIQVVGRKEMQRMCFLFNRYIAVAENVTQTQYRILEHGMIPLSGAQLHKSVDIEGQALQPDLKSGRQEDRLAFRLSFVSNESLYFRVARPNELKGWVERLEKSIQESQQANEQPEAEEFCPYPADIGPKIAAASLEKLFQQLTSPQIFREDFTDVFLLTHSCFTTPRDVLTALVNCVKSYEDSMSDTSSQASGNFAFPFSMEELSPCVSASPSSCNLQIDSEAGSPTPGSLWPGGVSSTSPTPSPSNQLQRNGVVNPSERKSVLSGSSFVSSSTDSDTSPHTSAVVDGNTLAMMKTNGWGIESKGLDSNDGDTDPYSRLIPRDRVHVVSAESEGEEDIDGGETPRNLSLSGSIPGEKSLAQSKGDVSSQLETEDGVSTVLGQSRMKHSRSVMEQLDESSHMLDMLTQSLNMDFNNSNPTTPLRNSTHNNGNEKRPHLSHSNSKDSSVFSEIEEQEYIARYQATLGSVKRRSRTLSENASRQQVVSNLSTSEPDLANLDVDDDEDTPPPLPPRTPDMLMEPEVATREARSLSAVGGRMIRGSSEHSLLTASCNIGPGHHRSLYIQSTAAMLSPAHHKPRSALSTPERRKHGTFDNGGSKTPKKQLSGKKSNTFGRYSPVPPGEQGSKKDRSKSRWGMVKKKVSKTFKRLPSMEGGANVQSSPRESRSQSIPLIQRNNVMRKTSVGPEVKLSVAVDAPDGGSSVPSPARRQRTLSVQGGGVTLIAKIFSVLGCWQENYFEDFESDGELRQLLEDFLQSIIDKSSMESQEYAGALHLLESMSDKRLKTVGETSAKAPSFPVLLQRVTKIEPEVLKMYDWDHPDKLMAGKQIDLGRNHPKDTMFLKIVAEQLTMMEFAVYSAVQRRELLKCAWKKPDKETQAPNLCRLIRRTNEMTSWVSTEILSHETPQLRAKVIENFVQIAHYCYSHNDFHCALNITIALGSACIKGLRQTWEEVEKKYKTRLEKLKNQVDYHGRCKKMREKLEKLTEESLQRTNKLPNALPYIGAYLDQIYALEMNSKTYNPDGLVNFAKMTKLAQMIQAVLQYQKSRFGFEPRLDVMAYVTAAKRLSENDLYELSTKREPHSH